MVGVTIECRLGNQLFQYAFAKALSERLKTRFYLNEKVEKFKAAEYFDLKGYSPLKNKVNKALLKIQSKRLLSSLQSISIESANSKFTNNTLYKGYFQSEAYFDNIATRISSYIRVKQVYKDAFNDKYKSIFSAHRVIAIHIRRGDYLELNDWWGANLGSNNLTLPTFYYIKSLEHIPDHQNWKVIFVSDDIEFVKQQFGHIKNADFSENSSIIDFQIIMNADACILSNSSFAWWAAYLNPKDTKQIYCPKYWLGFKIKKEYPENIVPENWIQIDAE